MEISSKHLERLASFYREHHRELPWRQTKDPYAIWVSEIMLQQTRVEAVIGYYHRFLNALPTLKDLAEAEEQTVLKLWEGLGYYSRARNLQKAARKILAEYDGRMPQTVEELRALPGIGDYTAGAIASIAFDAPYAAVDGNVLRVCSRLTGDTRPVDLPKVKKDWTQTLTALYPRQGAGIWNQALMELGATICLPSGTPKCALCPWNEDCVAHRENSWPTLPVKLPKREKRLENWTVLCMVQQNRVLLEQRPEKGLLAGMFQFPMREGHLSRQALSEYLQTLGLSPISLEPLGSAKHLFTHITWQMEGYLCRLACGPVPDSMRAASLKELQEDFPMPGAQLAYRAAVEDLLASGTEKN